MKASLIAPCGMNCKLCIAFLREKNRCKGCRNLDVYMISRDRCIIRNCNHLKKNNWKFCSDKCKEYPCQRLKGLDKRYRTKYQMSMIENLAFIKEKGIKKFLEHEKQRWEKGNKIFCVHNKSYFENEQRSN